MHIKCPSCDEDNEIEFGENIVCGSCKKTFSGYYYHKIKKPILSATTAMLIGAFGAYKVDQVFFEKYRYPLDVEYELLNVCINSFSKPVRSSVYAKRTKQCICGLEKTLESVSYKELKENELLFQARFQSDFISCR